MPHRFDETDETLSLLPLGARRALDRAGLRLSREGWRSLPLAVRRDVVALGEERVVEVERVRAAVAPATPAAAPMDPVPDPPTATAPAAVRAAFGPTRPLSDAVWSSLSPFDRYALAKVADRGREERIAAAYAEIVGSTAISTHLGPAGGARMVDVAEKAVTHRRATAGSRVTMSPEAFEKLTREGVAKGDVLGTARIAGIMAAKRTHELIPLCHPIALSKVRVELEPDAASCSVHVTATAEALDRTGVEMEALVAASVAALTVYDMLKGVDRGIVIGDTRLLSKSGGRSGDYSARDGGDA